MLVGQRLSVERRFEILVPSEGYKVVGQYQGVYERRYWSDNNWHNLCQCAQFEGGEIVDRTADSF